MEIKVTAHTRAKNPRITVNELGHLNVYVNQPAVDGKANTALVNALAEHFKVAKSQIKLVKGLKSKIKIFVINVKK
jgi:uncharacterized protein (TIGR00251 family)